MQTDKVQDFPVVLVGSDYWAGLGRWLREQTLAQGMIAEGDLDLVTITDDPERVVAILASSYGQRTAGHTLSG
jgi:hypothetical protein